MVTPVVTLRAAPRHSGSQQRAHRREPRTPRQLVDHERVAHTITTKAVVAITCRALGKSTLQMAARRGMTENRPGAGWVRNLVAALGHR